MNGKIIDGAVYWQIIADYWQQVASVSLLQPLSLRLTQEGE